VTWICEYRLEALIDIRRVVRNAILADDLIPNAYAQPLDPCIVVVAAILQLLETLKNLSLLAPRRQASTPATRASE
jgi:hypothetical protein